LQGSLSHISPSGLVDLTTELRDMISYFWEENQENMLGSIKKAFLFRDYISKAKQLDTYQRSVVAPRLLLLAGPETYHRSSKN
jgi:hypothetical protein